MKVPRSFQTARLWLRAPAVADAGPIFEGYAQDPQVVRFLVWKPHQALEETRQFLSTCAENWEKGSDNTWALLSKESGQVIGMISARKNGPIVEMGYVLARMMWGRGLMAEAAQVVGDWWLMQEEIDRVQALCDMDNLASARVMEKIGMRREGSVRRCTIHPNISTEPRDCFLYAKVRLRGLE